MTHQDHNYLLQKEITRPKGVWADLGSGRGAFTLALADIGGPKLEIFSVDMNKLSLQMQKNLFADKFPDANIHFLDEDFRLKMNIPKLDGIIMANSLHFHFNKMTLLRHVLHYLKPGSKFILIEYNVDDGNQWVPYPVSFKSFIELCPQVGLDSPRLLAKVRSGFLDEIFSAIAIRS